MNRDRRDKAMSDALGRPASRRGVLKGFAALMAAGAVAPLAAACAQQQPAAPKPAEQPAAKSDGKPAGQPAAGVGKTEPKPAAGEPKRGGTLRVAILGEPPHLDPMFGTQTVTANTMWHVFESLWAPNAKGAPTPFLVEKYDASSDGKQATLGLRKGVLFHNEKEMTSADVVASLQRYGQMAARGRLLFSELESISATDKYAVTMNFKEPRSGIVPVFLARTDAIIMPEDIATAFPKEKFTQYIGTGPYRFLEHLPDRHVRLGRWDKYVDQEAAPDGAAGKRVAHIDELMFIPVPEESVRADGVGSGEYDYADTLAPDTYDKVRGLPNVTADIGKPYYWATPHFNKKESLFTNVKLRQAVLAAVQIEPIAAAAFGNKDFYRIGPEIAAPETAWYTDEGKDLYNKPDPEKAKALLREAGYDGTPIRWMSTKEYFYNYNGSLVFKQQLEAVGFKIDLQVTDWATLGRRRVDSKEYDVFVTAHESYSHPILHPHLGSAWPGWWTSEEKDKLASAIMAETDDAKQLDLIKQLQRLHYTEVPCLKYGEYFVLRARSNKVQGTVNPSDPYFWNAWLA
jgi:peptide/nickel transport system substrate-binding protein